MGKLKIVCTADDMEWLSAAIQIYDNQFAGTPPWADNVNHGDDGYFDKVIGEIEWEVRESELVPFRCPECDGDFVTMTAEYNEFPPKARGYYIECKNCGARTGFHRKKEGAIRSWNRKAEARID